MKDSSPHRLKQLYWALHKTVRDWRAPPQHPPARVAPVWQHPASKFGCELVLDVGANTGQYGSAIRRQGYTGRILSFEPLSSAHQALVEKAALDPAWDVYSRCAVGRAAGEAQINIAGNSVSSSLLPMLSLHADAAPTSVYTGSESTPIVTLDAAIASHAPGTQRIYLKIDTQGFEAEVLAGLQESLPLVRAMEMELSLSPLYAGQPPWRELIAQVEDAGFVIVDLRKAFADRRTGQLLQIDAVFARPAELVVQPLPPENSGREVS